MAPDFKNQNNFAVKVFGPTFFQKGGALSADSEIPLRSKAPQRGEAAPWHSLGGNRTSGGFPPFNPFTLRLIGAFHPLFSLTP